VPHADGLRHIPIDQLQRGQYQPRSDIRQDTLEDLASSIRAQGIVQPIVARSISAKDGLQRYEIVVGERRWRAAQMAGLDEIPAVVKVIPDEAAIAMALIENIQRENLNPLEEARALERLIREFNMTHQKAAEAVGRSRAAVTNLLRLLDLSAEVKALVEGRQLEMGHARALLALTDEQVQATAARTVVARGFSVRQTESLVKRVSKRGGRKKHGSGQRDPDICRLEADLAEKLGTSVRLQHQVSGKGKLSISYNSLDELEGILRHIR
jgi:ParB family chromosome partitioning protein